MLADERSIVDRLSVDDGVDLDAGRIERINRLIDEIRRDPFGGIGKPEQLKHALAGTWSRRINDEHRLVYLVDGDDLVILQVRFHYA